MDENKTQFGRNGEVQPNGVNGTKKEGGKARSVYNIDDELDGMIPTGLSDSGNRSRRPPDTITRNAREASDPSHLRNSETTSRPRGDGIRGDNRNDLQRRPATDVTRSDAHKSAAPDATRTHVPRERAMNDMTPPSQENLTQNSTRVDPKKDRYGMPTGRPSPAPRAVSSDIAAGGEVGKASPKGKKQKKAKRPKSGESANSIMSIIKCMAYITGVFAIAAVISVVIIISANDIFAFSKSDEKIEVVIPDNATVDEIAKILSDEGVVKYEFLFKTYAGIRHKTDGFCGGTYEVSPSMNYDKLLGAFVEQIPTGVQWVTIPEGFTTDEIIDLLVSVGIGEREKYIDVINNYDFDFWFVDELGDDWAENGRIYRLDGYLFPDSYQFYNASSEVTVINKLLTRFGQVFTKTYRTYADTMGCSVDEVITLASIIEKEAGKQSEFNRVSSVFHNRMDSDAFSTLDSDATVMYVIEHETGERPELTSEDLEKDTPYNTYKHPGLTPGPISNPSNSAILAALNPEKTDYYYFVSYKDNTYFSATKPEHDARVAEIAALKAAEKENSAG